MKQALFNKLQQVSDENLINIEAHKTKGNSAIGFYCLYGPTELAIAADAIPLPLCGTRNDPIEAAENDLPRNLCPLIKSSYGFAVTDTCPFFRVSDLIVADTTCDGKKKMFEIMNQIKPVHVLQLPQQQDVELFLGPWIDQLEKLKQVIEATTKTTITDEKLSDAIDLMNRERAARKRLMDVTKANPSPITGMELLEILFKSGFFADKEQGIALMEELAGAFEQMARDGVCAFPAGSPRILLTGVPVGLGSHKVIQIIEESKANVVALESCSGYKQVFEVDKTLPPIEALARQYLAVPCSVMSPNPGRMDLLRQMITDFKVDGVVDLTWQACHTYNVEAFQVQKLVSDEMGLPCLHIETDYSLSDTEQLRVRIQAFIEMI